MDDPLTKIDNRATFFKQLSKTVMKANEYRSSMALLLIDINRLSRINSLYGYDSGDIVLQNVAQVLKGVKRQQDYIARIGDNRFALILSDIMNVGHSQLAAHKIIRLLEVPFEIKDEKIKVEVTIGISLCPLHTSKTEALLRECEDALEFARQNEQAIGVTQLADDDEISDFWDIELGLTEALETEQLQVFYQPKLCIKTGKPLGAEALLRWIHPVRGFIVPDLFIPIAEKTGQIKPITSWILNTVLRQSSKWSKKWGPLSISVNIPPNLILHSDLRDFVHNSLNLWGNENITLVLEIIERTLISDTDKSFIVLKDLQDKGIKISIDDFGTGYSTLSYFKHLPVNELKIDKSFVFELLTDSASQNIVKLIIDLAHSFNLDVVAEGVEDLQTLMALKKLECDEAQGYFIARPMPHDDFCEWLENFKGVDKK